jgi:hypothetical protein
LQHRTGALFRILCRVFRASSQVDGSTRCEWVKFNHTNSLTTKERIMKVSKNMEGIFLAVAVMTTWAAYATAETPAVAAPAKVQSVANDATMQVVVVKAKRLTAAEKASQD